LRAAGKFTGLGGLELNQSRSETNKCLLRIFTNSIYNALKYGGDSLTRISIGYEDSESLHIFSVSDDGKGLKEVASKKIFGLFQGNETSKGVEGADQGLAIVKEIAEQHGGRVRVEP
jgi:light-regulated signal transduction histidine kinase (bacteriophytochrome)